MSRKKQRKAQQNAAPEPTFAADPFAALQLDNLPAAPEAPAAPPAPNKPTFATKRVNFRIERKGRAGKVVTILEGWLLDDVERLPELAATIQRKIGAGGAACNNWIELQGDQRRRAREILREMGFALGGQLP